MSKEDDIPWIDDITPGMGWNFFVTAAAVIGFMTEISSATVVAENILQQILYILYGIAWVLLGMLVKVK